MGSAQKPSIPKGMRDFSPIEMGRRNYIFDVVKSVFRKCGYKEIQTPSLENLTTLLGKYGTEGDKLLFKVLNSGNAFEGVLPEELENSNALSLKVCEKGLRYDLTVPFARYVVLHRNELTFPFKRFQIQPVWRADRPQKGRYREFYQCDVDVVGSTSLLNEVELIQIVDEVFTKFGIRVLIKINNRKILQALADVMGCPEKLVEITIAIDKIEKIGLESVKEELRGSGIEEKAINILEPLLLAQGSSSEKLSLLKEVVSNSEIGLKGIQEVEFILDIIKGLSLNNLVELDLSLARGLNYYTGAIFEVKALDFEIGSICGGGRYDNLTGIFGLPDVSGVGISFGADRIYDVLLGLDKFPAKCSETTQILFSNMDESVINFSLTQIQLLRKAGISCELYPQTTKLKKQFEYAEKNGVKFLAIVGEEEVNGGYLNIKNLETGMQERVNVKNLAEKMLNFFGN